jgi:hypothetical protein
VNAVFLQGEAQIEAQRAQVRQHPQIFREGGHEWQQHWRSRHCIIFSRSVPAGTQHNFYAYRLAIVSGEEIRGDLLKKSHSLNDAISVCASVESFA